MSAADYQKEVMEPAREVDLSDEEFVKKISGKFKTAFSDIKAREDMLKKPRIMEEDELTKKVANYLEELRLKGKVLKYSHIPASTYTKYRTTKARNTAMGVRPGVPDMLIVFKHNVLFLELKREKGGRLSEFQKEWIAAINKIDETTAYAQGSCQVKAVVAHGWAEAETAINSCFI